MRHDAAAAMQRTLPNGRFLEIRDVGHQLIVEQPEVVAVALESWLVAG
jgi:pimeloyl-ACP methyl ester carboxylesterase